MESVKQWVESVLFDELWALVTVPLVSSSHSAMPVTSVYQVAAAAAKSLQSCPTLCDPIDGSPPGPIVPGILQARTLEWVAISSSNAWEWKVKVKELSCVQLLATSWTAAYQAPPSMGFSRQEYWSGEIEMDRQYSSWLKKPGIHSSHPLSLEEKSPDQELFSWYWDVLFAVRVRWANWNCSYRLECVYSVDWNFSPRLLKKMFLSIDGCQNQCFVGRMIENSYLPSCWSDRYFFNSNNKLEDSAIIS